MPDYIYLLENRLSADQRNAISKLREAAHEAGTILFLTGDAVRDLTSGHPIGPCPVVELVHAGLVARDHEAGVSGLGVRAPSRIEGIEHLIPIA